MESADLWGPSQGGGKCPSKGMQSVKDLPNGIASFAPKEPKDFLIMPSTVIPEVPSTFSSFCLPQFCFLLHLKDCSGSMSRGVLELQAKSLGLPLWSGNDGLSCRRTDSTHCFRVAMVMLKRETWGQVSLVALGVRYHPSPHRAISLARVPCKPPGKLGVPHSAGTGGKISRSSTI